MYRALTKADIDRYYKDGYMSYGKILSDEELTEVRNHVDGLIARLPAGVRSENLNMPHTNDSFLLKLCSHPGILDVIERFIGPNIVLFASHIISKRQGDGLPLPWHQDAAYWALEPMKVMTLWLAIDDSTVENGCMRVIPESHTWGLIPHVAYTVKEQVLDQEMADIKLDESKAVDVELKAGECSFHEPFLIHGSKPNFSTKRRCGYTMRFMPPETKLNRSGRFANHPLFLLRGRDTNHTNTYANVQ
jgi:phytanoyl-CoA hydroxylase